MGVLMHSKGLNDSKKRNIIKGCLSRWKPAIVYLQETKLEVFSNRIIKSLWRLNDVGWISLLALGTAGGILLIWNKEKVKCINYFIVNIAVSCQFVRGS